MNSCKECGIENKDHARFCRNCGAAIHEQDVQERKTRECPACGGENPKEARFCSDCGAEVRHHRETRIKHDQQHVPRRKKQRHVETRLTWHPAFVVFAMIGIVAVVLMIPYILGNGPGTQPTPIVEERSLDPQVEARVTSIASRFSCSCGSCGEEPLDTCSCGRAVEERSLIRNRVQAGQGDEEIIQAVNSMYGFLKGKSEELLGSNEKGKSEGRVRTSSGMTPLSVSTPRATNARIARTSDRIEVFSHFRCPCGQCGIDELKDCSCNHPRGAQEVKRFVDEKISEDKYTVNQLVALVEKRYGSKKVMTR